MSKRFGEYCRIPIGTEYENPAWITGHDWHGPIVPWNHRQIRTMPHVNGFWAIRVDRGGRYRFTLRHQPKEANFVLQAKTARLVIGDVDKTRSVPKGVTSIVFEVELKAGEAKMQTWLTDAEDKSRGAFFVEVELLP